jgi:tRNA modification GTPase
MILDDTIVAISSAVGPAARMIVRVSGADARGIARNLGCFDGGEELTGIGVGQISGDPKPFGPTSAAALHCRLTFSGLIVPAWAYFFIGPRSFTGQDSLELHIPGNPLLARMLLDAIVALGGRQAEAGEFSARAYFNGKIDLTQAEGVAAAIAATSAQELSAARQLMAGELTRRLRPVMDLLADTLALVEVGIDFSEEDVQFLNAEQISSRLKSIVADLHQLVEQSARFERLQHEPRVVLAGRPNAGKSTLLNALAGMNRAIVSPVAGTTRDAISAEVMLPGGMVHLVDMAGLEESNDEPGGSRVGEHEIPAQMHERAMRAIEECDLLILVRDATDSRPELELPRKIDLRVISKVDLILERTAGMTAAVIMGSDPIMSADRSGSEMGSDPILSADEQMRAIPISAATGEGMQTLRLALNQIVFGAGGGESRLALAARHLQAIQQAMVFLDRGMILVNEKHLAELLAAELREALDELSQILGVVTPDDILGKIFSAFCIGK